MPLRFSFPILRAPVGAMLAWRTARIEAAEVNIYPPSFLERPVEL